MVRYCTSNDICKCTGSGFFGGLKKETGKSFRLFDVTRRIEIVRSDPSERQRDLRSCDRLNPFANLRARLLSRPFIVPERSSSRKTTRSYARYRRRTVSHARAKNNKIRPKTPGLGKPPSVKYDVTFRRPNNISRACRGERLQTIISRREVPNTKKTRIGPR